MSNNQSTIGKTSASEVNNSRILYGFYVTSLFRKNDSFNLIQGLFS